MCNIVGRGMLAQAFSKTELDDRFLLFASGVSNSSETRTSEFVREEALLIEQINLNPEKTIIYFSTCSIYQKNQTEYALHKLSMEKHLRIHAKHYHIYRLPQVVGVVDNTTLISYFVKAILFNEPVELKADAQRNLVAVSDIYRLVEKISRKEFEQSFIMNIAASFSVEVTKIYKHISCILGHDSKHSIVSGGEIHAIDIALLKDFLSGNDPLLKCSYWKSILDSYVPQIVSLVSSSRSVDEKHTG